MNGDAMAISLECKCGKKLKAAENLAGKMFQCPDCGAAVRVPRPAAPIVPRVESEQTVSVEPLPAAPTLPAAPGKPRKKKSPARDREYMIGMAIAGAVMLAVTFGGWVGYRFIMNYSEYSEARSAADFLLSENSSDQDVVRRGRAAIPALREDLHDRDTQRQLRAVKLLGAIGPKASAATPDLIDVLKRSKDAQVKVSAVETLVRLGASEALPDLLGEIKDVDANVRAATIRAVAALGGPEAQVAIPVFIVVLKSDRATEPRVAAVEALAGFRGAASEAIPELVEACDSADANLSTAAVRALVHIHPADPQVLPTLIKSLKKDATLADAATALAMMGNAARTATPDLFQSLARAGALDRNLSTGPQAGRPDLFNARQGFGSFHATATAAVEAALESVADGELAEIVAARRGQQAEPVRAALKSADPLVRKAAAEALASWPGGGPAPENGGSN